ncbi:hypothetical protein QMM42_18045, partial [Leptospira santarosai]|uniref:hypothetical protein n=1 Tax=Leptospira santarosai TaxID=28183 RepID=UPI0024AF8C2C
FEPVRNWFRTKRIWQAKPKKRSDVCVNEAGEFGKKGKLNEEDICIVHIAAITKLRDNIA